MAKSKESSGELSENNPGWLSSAINGVVGLTNGFNYKAQENNLAMAQLNADAQKSASDAEKAGRNQKTIIVVVVVVALLIAVMMFTGKNK